MYAFKLLEETVKALSKIFFFLTCISLGAQNYSYLVMGQWVDDQFVMGIENHDGYKVFDFEKKVVYTQRMPYAPLPKNQEVAEGVNRTVFDGAAFIRPRMYVPSIGQSSIFIADGQVCTIVWCEGDEPTLQLAYFVDGEWEPQAELGTISQGVILPLRSGNFLVGLREGHATDGGEKHDPRPFGRYRKNSRGELVLIDIIDTKLPSDNINIANFTSHLASRTNHIAITDDHYTYIDPDTGTFWTFSKDTGRLIRSRALYSAAISALNDGKTIVPAIIGAQPTPDGQILVSAWSSKVCIEGGEIIQAMNVLSNTRNHNLSREEAWEQMTKLAESLFAIDPLVRWYRYDPAFGTITMDTSAPAGGKDIINSRIDFLMESRHWCLNSDGTELFYINLDGLALIHPERKVDIDKVTKQFFIE